MTVCQFLRQWSRIHHYHLCSCYIYTQGLREICSMLCRLSTSHSSLLFDWIEEDLKCLSAILHKSTADSLHNFPGRLILTHLFQSPTTDLDIWVNLYIFFFSLNLCSQYTSVSEGNTTLGSHMSLQDNSWSCAKSGPIKSKKSSKWQLSSAGAGAGNTETESFRMDIFILKCFLINCTAVENITFLQEGAVGRK